MTFLNRFTLRSLILIAVVVLTACASGSGSDDNDNDQGNGTDTSPPAAVLSTLCGVFQGTEIVLNPIEFAERVSVEILSSDAAIVTRESGAMAGQEQLIKFHGITSAGVETLRVLNGIDVLKRLLSAGAMFVSAGEDCAVTFVGGGAGIMGQLFSIDGQNVNELMNMEAAALPSALDICQGNTLAQCYATIGVTPRQPTDIELDVQNVSIGSRCGAVLNGALENPVLQAEIVRVEPVSTDEVIATRLVGVEAGNMQLVKLHGLSSVGVAPIRLQEGQDFIINSSFGGAYLVVESQQCAVELGSGGSGVVGQLYSTDGVSINEQLLAQGYAISTTDSCNGELLTECYQEIEAEAPPLPTPTPLPPSPPPDTGGGGGSGGGSGGGESEGVIRDFLWKPVSEGNGNVAVLVNPRNVRIVVSGAISETLRDQGPSNGRGTTARGSAPGCNYGSNVQLQFFNSSGELIPVITGGTSVVVANGCNRQEFRR